MSTIIINGKTISVIGKNFTIKNNKVFVNGDEITTGDEKTINITVDGSVEKLEVDCCEKIQISGDAGIVKTQSGDVDISGNVTGSIHTMSGDVKCGNVEGGVSTMSGDIKYSK